MRFGTFDILMTHWYTSMKFGHERISKHAPQDVISRDWKTASHVAESTLETAEGVDAEKIKNELYRKFMQQHIVDYFFESMRDVGFKDSEINEMQDALSACSDQEILGALSIPYELREKQLSRIADQLDSGKVQPKEAIAHLVAVGKKYGFGVGYHTSPHDIRPDALGAWTINGTEPDHRDDDMTMAYYSTQYRHLFKKKDPRFIYAVRTTASDRTDGNWYRAPSLSVIMRIPFAEVHGYVESVSRDIHTKKNPTTESIDPTVRHE
jgi:hypothetical protein